MSTMRENFARQTIEAHEICRNLVQTIKSRSKIHTPIRITSHGINAILGAGKLNLSLT